MLLHYRSRFPLVSQVKSNVILLPQIVLASLGMFFTAYALLFKLYFPSRYTESSLRIVMSIAAGMALTILLDAVWHWVEQRDKPHFPASQFLALISTAVLGAVLILYPLMLRLNSYPFPNTGYRVGKVPPLYEFFAQQPKDTLIASLAIEANNLPTFSQRSILVGREYAISAFHPQHYTQVRQRAIDLINAQYSPTLKQVQIFIQTYGVDFWLLEREAFTPEYVAKNSWLRQFQPAAAEATARLEQGTTPALSQVMERCSVLETGDLVVLQAECIAKAR